MALFLWLLVNIARGVAVNSFVPLEYRQRYSSWKLNRRTRVILILWAAMHLAPILATAFLVVGFQPLGGLIQFGGALLVVWAMAVNPYFVPEIRWVPEHLMVHSGPYRYLRHPGYVGMLLQAGGTAVLFSNLLVTIACIAYSIAILSALLDEDRLLYKPNA